MNYHLKRYFYSLSRRRWLLLLAIFPVLIYLFFAYQRPAFFVISQDVFLDKSDQIMWGGVGKKMNLEEFVKNSDSFVSRFSTGDALRRHLQVNSSYPIDKIENRTLATAVNESMTLAMKNDGTVSRNTTRIS